MTDSGDATIYSIAEATHLLDEIVDWVSAVERILLADDEGKMIWLAPVTAGNNQDNRTP